MKTAHRGHTSRRTAEDEVDIDEEPVDTGLIRCICSSSEDDGFTIQCEKCLVWQHAFCVKISQHNIPEHYLCDQCEAKLQTPTTRRRFGFYSLNDSEEGVQDGSERRKSRSRSEASVIKRKEDKHKNRSSTGDNEKHHFRDIFNRILDSADDDDYKPAHSVRQPPSQRKNPVGRPPSKKPKLSKKISVNKRSLFELNAQEELLLQERRLRLRKSKYNHDDYEPVEMNIVRSQYAREIFRDTFEKWNRFKDKNGISQNSADGVVAQPSKDIVVMDGTSVSPKASVRPVPRSTFFSQDSHGSSSKGLFADVSVPANRFLTEIYGDITLKSEYKFDPDNNFAMLGTTCPHVFFYPTLDLCVDARYRGNEARFIRRSCHPNAELRSIIPLQAKGDQTIRLGVFAKDDIVKGQEITIGWNWQRGHISWKRNLEWHRHQANYNEGEVIDEEEERSKRLAVANMLAFFDAEYGDCACKDTELCFIKHLKLDSAAGTYEDLVGGLADKSTKAVTNGIGHVDDTGHLRKQKNSDGRSHCSRLESSSPGTPAQPSRQTIVSRGDAGDRTSTGNHTESAEEGGDIDIISTSPLGGSPIVHSPTTTTQQNHESDEELDVDGYIDIGEELTVSRPKDKSSAMSCDESLSAMSSLSSLSGFEKSDEEGHHESTSPGTEKLRRLRQKQVKQEETESTHDAKAWSGKATAAPLSCKKLWMQKYLREIGAKQKKPNDTSETSVNNGRTHGDMSVECPEAQVSEKQIDDSRPVEKVASVAPENPQKSSNAVMEIDTGNDVDLGDGELSDASSASTIPIVEEQSIEECQPIRTKREPSPNHCQPTYVDHDVPQSLSSGDSCRPSQEPPPAAESTPPPAKPVKVKLSLQEYLSRRAASRENITNNNNNNNNGTTVKSTQDVAKASINTGTCNGVAPMAIDIAIENDKSEAIVNQH